MHVRNSTQVRLLVRLLVGVVFLSVVLFRFINSVGAKGPESATITGPGIDRPMDLIDLANPDLVAKLMEQTGLWYGTGELSLPQEQPPGELGPSYTLTWINGGPPGKSVEGRTIRQVIYLEAENGPLIHTPAQGSLQGWGRGVIGWYAAPGGLRETLAELGVPLYAASSFNEAVHYKRSTNVVQPEGEPVGAPWYLGIIGFVLLTGLAGTLRSWAMKGRKG